VRHRFDGEIYGFGTSSGDRVVVGRWWSSPFGAFADVMIEHSDGRRCLIAPRLEIARFIADTYQFDDVVTATVEFTSDGHCRTVRAGRLNAEITVGRRSAVGLLLRLVPPRLRGSPGWATMIDPIARLVLAGVRTRGESRGRREWYGAHDVHRLAAVVATWNGISLGTMADVVPPVRFGFGSTPRVPGVVRVTTTVSDRLTR
jgi:hypothetical protein